MGLTIRNVLDSYPVTKSKDLFSGYVSRNRWVRESFVDVFQEVKNDIRDGNYVFRSLSSLCEKVRKQAHKLCLDVSKRLDFPKVIHTKLTSEVIENSFLLRLGACSIKLLNGKAEPSVEKKKDVALAVALAPILVYLPLLSYFFLESAPEYYNDNKDEASAVDETEGDIDVDSMNDDDCNPSEYAGENLSIGGEAIIEDLDDEY